MTPTLDLEELKRKLVHHKFTLHHIGLYDLMVDALEQQASRIKELERELEEARNVRGAAENLIKVKGRHHTEIAYHRLFLALDAARQQKG